MKVRIPNQGGSQKDMMQRVQKLQEDMKATQAALEEKVYEVPSAGGKITVSITGAKEVRGIKIDPALIDPDDPEMLEDMIAAAMNEAISTADEDYNNEMAKLTGGLNIPGLGF